jgi:Flp pilus assembly protein TadD
MMNNRTRATLLASALIFGSSMVGCSGASLDRRPAASAAQAPVTASRIEKALAAKDFARALTEAERLVSASPQEGSYRALLGRAYLANGRYASARAAFADAVALGNHEVRTIVSLALVTAGTGNPAQARELLSQNIGNLPAGDYGLAMAIAGDPQEGVRALLEAVAMTDATAQTRQNLAYAFALAGDWQQARLTASQDMGSETVQQRLSQWAQLAQPDSEPFRVAALTGVLPRLDDAGMPARLALDYDNLPVRQANSGTLVQQASADVDRAAPPVEQPVEMAAAAAPVSTETLAAAFDPATTSAAPVAGASSDTMREALKASFASKGRSGRTLVDAFPKPIPTEKASDWVVQLGAYDSPAVAADKWARLSKRRTGLRGFAVVNSTIDLKGRVFHRLAIRGFGDRSGAMSLCASMRASGQPCFVRVDDKASAGMMARAGTARGKQAAAAAAPAMTSRRVASR